jgi:beta-fructofuranosidase
MRPTEAPSETDSILTTATDPHRPRYHFTPPSGWMNDPNGLIQWDGRYHLFYQHNPAGAFWGDIHWGHAVSDDLLRWEHLPIALAPDPDGPDAGGCFSGCAVVDDGVVRFVYTGVDPQVCCLATGDPDLLTWTRHPGNPVIAGPPADLGAPGFRDHSVWREDGQWHQVIGSGIAGRGGAALHYRSFDLIDWEYLGPLLAGDRAESGDMWECPDFFPLGDRHALVLSVLPEKRVHYFSGAYREGRFSPDRYSRLDLGAEFYAPQTMVDDAGRRLMWGWLREGRTVDAQIAAGWSGAMSVPRVLAMTADGRLTARPVPELDALRGRYERFENLSLTPDADLRLPGVEGDSLDLRVAIEPGRATEVGLRVRCAPDGSELTTITYTVAGGALSIDRGSSSLDSTVELDVESGSTGLCPPDPVVLRVLLDRSVLEIFPEGGSPAATRLYPTRADSLGISFFARGAPARLTRLDCWQMDPA